MAKKQTKKPLPKLVEKAIPGVKVITLKKVQKDIALKDIIINDQARTEFDSDAIIELAKSIKENGLLQAIGVHLSKSKYYLIYGERRTRAMKLNKAAIINAMVYENLTPDQICELQITENLQRKDLNPIEEANAFKKLMIENKKTVSEIALRLSRSEKYITTRLKLADLIPEFQKALFQDRMTMKDAIGVCKFSAETQKKIWAEDGNSKESFSIQEYTFNEYSNDLKKAAFDTKDITLNKTMGACTTCIHNTAGNQLFPDEKGKSLCMNNKCFIGKSDTSFKIKLKKAIEDPGTILFNSNYYNGNFSTEMRKKGEKVYDKNSVTIVISPKEADIKSGKVVKAFCIEGEGKGNEGYCIILKATEKASSSSKPSAAAFKEKSAEGKTTNADINSEIKRIEEVEERKRKGDEEKIWPSIYKLIEDEDSFRKNQKELTLNEKITLIFVLLDDMGDAGEALENAGFKGNDYDEVEVLKWLKANTEKVDGIINNMQRMFFYDTISGLGSIEGKGEKIALLEVIKDYDAKESKALLDEMESERTKRKEKRDPIIAKLKSQLTTKSK